MSMQNAGSKINSQKAKSPISLISRQLQLGSFSDSRPAAALSAALNNNCHKNWKKRNMLAGCLDQGYVPRSTGEGFLPKSGYQNTSLLSEGSLEVKLPTIRTDGKAEVGREEERRSEKRKS